MGRLHLDVDEATADQLAAEADLLGFESRDAYLRWIVDHRAGIDVGGETNRILAAYAERIETLEARLDADDDGVADEPRASEADGQLTGTDHGTEAAGEHATGAPADTAADGDASPGIEASNVAPERVARIADDTVTESVDALDGVVEQRLDELARQAVARTRQRLGRDVDTGLEYRSHTTIGEDGPPPGADVTDLEALDVPGRSAAVVERRRRAVGAALAFLRDRGEARRSDFLEALYEEYPAGYDTERGWWRCVKAGLRQVEQVDGGKGCRTWRFASGEPTMPSPPGATVTRLSED